MSCVLDREAYETSKSTEESIIYMFENKVKTLLAQGKAVWGAALPDVSDLIAKMTMDTGVDFLWIDTEHFPYDATEIRWIPIMCRMKGCVPIVRVAGLDPQLIKKTLDVGPVGSWCRR